MKQANEMLSHLVLCCLTSDKNVLRSFLSMETCPDPAYSQTLWSRSIESNLFLQLYRQNHGKNNPHTNTSKITELQTNLFAFRKNTDTSTIASNRSNLDHGTTKLVHLDLEKAFELAEPVIITSILTDKDIKGKLLAWASDYRVTAPAP